MRGLSEGARLAAMKSPERRLSSRPASIDDIEGMAAAWLARRYGGFSLQDSRAFQTWLAADPRHAAAVANLEHAWQVVSSPGAAGQGRIAQERQRVRERRRVRRQRQVTLGLASLAAAALVVFAVLPGRRSDSGTPAKSAVALRPDVQMLPDGSKAELNAGAEVVVAFTASQRSVRLVRGEALFTVAADERRPFVVSAGGVNVTAVGTAFNVRFDPHQVAVLVTEGTVAVNRSAAARADDAKIVAEPAARVVEPLRVTAGQRTAVALEPESVPTVMPATPAEISAALAWRDRRIEFTGTALGEAFSLFNRQNAIQLIAGNARTAEFEISGIFWVDDPEAFVRLLDSAFDMSVKRDGERVVVRKR